MRAKEKERRLRIIDTFDDLSSHYGDEGLCMEEVNRRWFAPRIRTLSGSILDVGAGTGSLIEKYYDETRHTLTAVDFSAAMLGRCQERLTGRQGIRYVRADARRLPFADGSFDAAVSVNTLHNLPSAAEIGRALAEMARALKPGGVLLMDFRNACNPYRLWVRLKHDSYWLPQKTLVFPWTLATLRSLGFADVRGEPIADRHYDDYLARWHIGEPGRLSLWFRKSLDRSFLTAARIAVVAKKK